MPTFLDQQEPILDDFLVPQPECLAEGHYALILVQYLILEIQYFEDLWVGQKITEQEEDQNMSLSFSVYQSL